MILGDSEIRIRAHKTLLRKHHANSATRVVDEMGINHGKARIDIAVLNGSLTAFEIKSEKDSLDRLDNQAQLYAEVAHKAVLIASENHIKAALRVLPFWWGIIAVSKGPRNGVMFNSVRSTQRNRSINALSLCRLLWRSEAQDLMIAIGCNAKDTRKPREDLYQWLSANVSEIRLVRMVMTTLKTRENWRDQTLFSQCGDLFQHPSKL